MFKYIDPSPKGIENTESDVGKKMKSTTDWDCWPYSPVEEGYPVTEITKVVSLAYQVVAVRQFRVSTVLTTLELGGAQQNTKLLMHGPWVLFVHLKLYLLINLRKVWGFRFAALKINLYPPVSPYFRQN